MGQAISSVTGHLRKSIWVQPVASGSKMPISGKMVQQLGATTKEEEHKKRP